MKRTERITGVPKSAKDQIVDDYESEGAKVTIDPTGDTFTITAMFPEVQAAAVSNRASLLSFIRGSTTLGLAPEEDERPKREEIEAAAQSPDLYYPAAIRDQYGVMKTRGKYARGYPLGAVVHFTAGRDNPANDIRHALKQGYCYFVIGPDGATYQNFPLDQWGSHAGVSAWQGLGSGVSQHLVGIEICNAGELRKLDNGSYRPWYNEEKFLSPLGRKPDQRDDIPPSRVRTVERRENVAEGHYMKFTDLQEAALRTLLHWLHDNNPTVFSLDLVLGHDEVAPGRKIDPGGALSTSMPEFRARLKDG